MEFLKLHLLVLSSSLLLWPHGCNGLYEPEAPPTKLYGPPSDSFGSSTGYGSDSHFGEKISKSSASNTYNSDSKYSGRSVSNFGGRSDSQYLGNAGSQFGGPGFFGNSGNSASLLNGKSNSHFSGKTDSYFKGETKNSQSFYDGESVSKFGNNAYDGGVSGASKSLLDSKRKSFLSQNDKSSKTIYDAEQRSKSAYNHDQGSGYASRYGLGENYQQENYGHPKYDFEYQVNDDYGNDYGHQESRDGYDTKGSYYVLLPDGRKQIVNYYVDGDSGFVAEVTYEGEANYGPEYGVQSGLRGSKQYGISNRRGLESNQGYNQQNRLGSKQSNFGQVNRLGSGYSDSAHLSSRQVAQSSSSRKRLEESQYNSSQGSNYEAGAYGGSSRLGSAATRHRSFRKHESSSSKQHASQSLSSKHSVSRQSSPSLGYESAPAVYESVPKYNPGRY